MKMCRGSAPWLVGPLGAFLQWAMGTLLREKSFYRKKDPET